VLDVASVQASAHPATRPVELAGAVRYELGTSELAIDEREPRRRTIELVSTKAELAAYVSGSPLRRAP
jgi:hypothetical protein